MVESHRVPTSVCPNCGSKLDAVTQCEPPFSATPNPGDATVCARCGKIAVFDYDLKLREPTKKERKKIEKHPYMQKAQSFIFQRRN